MKSYDVRDRDGEGKQIPATFKIANGDADRIILVWRDFKGNAKPFLHISEGRYAWTDGWERPKTKLFSDKDKIDVKGERIGELTVQSYLGHHTVVYDTEDRECIGVILMTEKGYNGSYIYNTHH